MPKKKPTYRLTPSQAQTIGVLHGSGDLPASKVGPLTAADLESLRGRGLVRKAGRSWTLTRAGLEVAKARGLGTPGNGDGAGARGQRPSAVLGRRKKAKRQAPTRAALELAGDEFPLSQVVRYMGAHDWPNDDVFAVLEDWGCHYLRHTVRAALSTSRRGKGGAVPRLTPAARKALDDWRRRLQKEAA